MKKYSTKRFLAILLSFVALFQLSSFGFAKNSTPYTYDELPDDEVLCYYKGYPIYKENINESFRILEETLVMPLDSNIPDWYETGTIRPEYRGQSITVSGRFETYQYGENDTFCYLPVDAAQKVASKLESNDELTAIGIAATIGGIVGELLKFSTLWMGTVSLFTGLIGWARTERASAIREYTDAHKDVLYIASSSRFGTFWNVNYWDGRTCICEGRFISDGYEKTPGMPDYGVATYSEVLGMETENGVTSGIVY